jgi:hypothetical protein
MIPSKQRTVPAQASQRGDVIVDRGPHGPMSQQHSDSSHEMHPQKLVQLVGCHDPQAAKHEDRNPLR